MLFRSLAGEVPSGHVPIYLYVSLSMKLRTIVLVNGWLTVGYSAFLLFAAVGMSLKFDAPRNWMANYGFTDMRIVTHISRGEYYLTVVSVYTAAVVCMVVGILWLRGVDVITAELLDYVKWARSKFGRKG